MKSVSKYLNPRKSMVPEDSKTWQMSIGFKNFEKIMKSARKASAHSQSRNSAASKPSKKV